jgi:hypothetical protein
MAYYLEIAAAILASLMIVGTGIALLLKRNLFRKKIYIWFLLIIFFVLANRIFAVLEDFWHPEITKILAQLSVALTGVFLLLMTLHIKNKNKNI